MIKKFGFDIHGVMDTMVDTCKAMMTSFIQAGHEVHIVTGAPKARAMVELSEYGYEEGVHYTHFFSITDFHHHKRTPGLKYDECGEPWLPDNIWNSTKGMYLSKNNIDMHWDDSSRYAEYCNTPYSIVTNNHNRKKVAVYGGSFNPPTIAHKKVITTLLENGFDEVKVVPSYRHGIKGNQSESFSDRVNMCKHAFYNMGGVTICTWEQNNRTGYTYDLMNLIDNCNDDISIVIGKDNADIMDKWFKGTELVQRYPFIVLSRHGERDNSNDWYNKKPHQYITLDSNMDDVSSSHAREDIKTNGQSIMVDHSVLEYAKENKLYE